VASILDYSRFKTTSATDAGAMFFFRSGITATQCTTARKSKSHSLTRFSRSATPVGENGRTAWTDFRPSCRSATLPRLGPHPSWAADVIKCCSSSSSWLSRAGLICVLSPKIGNSYMKGTTITNVSHVSPIYAIRPDWTPGCGWSVGLLQLVVVGKEKEFKQLGFQAHNAEPRHHTSHTPHTCPPMSGLVLFLTLIVMLVFTVHGGVLTLNAYTNKQCSGTPSQSQSAPSGTCLTGGGEGAYFSCGGNTFTFQLYNGSSCSGTPTTSVSGPLNQCANATGGGVYYMATCSSASGLSSWWTSALKMLEASLVLKNYS